MKKTKPCRAATPLLDRISDGIAEASGQVIGVLNPEADRVIDEFHRFNTEPARAAFAGHWLNIMARRLDDTWPAVYQLLALVRDRGLYKDPVLRDPFGQNRQGKTYESFEAYFVDVMGKPFETWAELECTHRFAAECCPRLLEEGFEKASRAAKAQRAAAENKEPLRDRPGSPTGENKRQAKNGNEKENSNHSTQKGNAAAYRVKKLRRDAPAVAEQLERGEYKSVAAAERAARGEEPHPPRRNPTPFEVCKRLLPQLTATERAELRQMLDIDQAGR